MHRSLIKRLLLLSLIAVPCRAQNEFVEVRGRDGAVLGDRHIGRVFARGPSIMQEYKGRPVETLESLSADGWLETGDLGYRIGETLVITGRAKDLIIIRGRNYYPQDVEAIVGQIDGVNPGRVVAFGIPDEATGTEKLIIMLETMDGFTGSARDLKLAVRREIAQMLDCTPGDVSIVPRRTLIKSTSGKLARADNRSRYLDGMKGQRRGEHV